MKRYVLIVAGGKGLRMGGELPKQFMLLGGRPLLMRTLECFYRWDAGAERILVLPAGHQGLWERLCEEFHCRIPHRVAEGGETRFHSVQKGLSLPEHDGWVGIHDGVRPLTPRKLIENCFAAAERHGAAVPLTPLTDSIRRIDETGESRPADRSRLFAVQTPQVFRLEWAREAYRQQSYTPDFTDDASVVEAAGRRIHTVAGSRENIKITTPFDLLIAEALLNNPSPYDD